MTPAKLLPEPQRKLFYGIWTLVALGAALWSVPSPDRWSKDRLGAPKVVVGPELQTMFVSGVVIEHASESFLLQMKLKPEYVSTIPTQGREFALGYQYRKAGSVLRHGHLPLRVPADARVQFHLPNPERNHPTEILLSLLP